MFFASSENPGVGPSIRNIEFNVYNRSATTVAVGDVLMLDHLAADGAGYSAASYSTNDTVGYALGTVNVDGGTADANAATWPWGNAIVPTTAGIGALQGSVDPGTGAGGAPLVVVTSLLGGTGADNTKIRVCIDGIVPVTCLTLEPVVFGDSLAAANAAKTLTPGTTAAGAGQTAGVRMVAKALGNKGGTETQPVLVYFCGWNMFSQIAAS